MPDENRTELANIRRFEAAGFRAWPATSVHYDGTWAVRLTGSHRSGRLNSINPLDPGDCYHLDERIERLSRSFRAHGRAPTFRLSPLAAPEISRHLDELGWLTAKPATVMRLPLTDAVVRDAMHQIPFQDMNRFVDAAFQVHGYGPELRPGFTEVISSIKPEAGLFILEEDEIPVSAAICAHDGIMAGLFEVATVESERGKGHARRLILSALKWAYSRGAKQAWLQVEESNATALKLYRSLGFIDVYHYHYRHPSEQD